MVVVVATSVRLLFRPSRDWPLKVWLGGAAAWYSHLLLDTTYNHGKGHRHLLADERRQASAIGPVVRDHGHPPFVEPA